MGSKLTSGGIFGTPMEGSLTFWEQTDQELYASIFTHPLRMPLQKSDVILAHLGITAAVRLSVLYNNYGLKIQGKL